MSGRANFRAKQVEQARQAEAAKVRQSCAEREAQLQKELEECREQSQKDREELMERLHQCDSERAQREGERDEAKKVGHEEPCLGSRDAKHAQHAQYAERQAAEKTAQEVQLKQRQLHSQLEQSRAELARLHRDLAQRSEQVPDGARTEPVRAALAARAWPFCRCEPFGGSAAQAFADESVGLKELSCNRREAPDFEDALEERHRPFARFLSKDFLVSAAWYHTCKLWEPKTGRKSSAALFVNQLNTTVTAAENVPRIHVTIPSPEMSVLEFAAKLLSRMISALPGWHRKIFSEKSTANTPGLWDKRPALDGGMHLRRDEANIVPHAVGLQSTMPPGLESYMGTVAGEDVAAQQVPVMSTLLGSQVNEIAALLTRLTDAEGPKKITASPPAYVKSAFGQGQSQEALQFLLAKTMLDSTCFAPKQMGA
eukprot:Skav200563  [mRNA]  locus=scaffold917:30578:40808:+ [translate_table: standard]